MADPADQIAAAVAASHTDEARRRTLRALHALVDDATAYVVKPRRAVELMLAAVRDHGEGRSRPAEVALIWSTLAGDLAQVERREEQREIYLGWAAWHLGRATLAMVQDELPLAAARARDVVRCVAELMVYEGALGEPAEGTSAAREHRARVAAVCRQITARIEGVLAAP